jgi:imidazolonepropionase-like amidohydrolase
MVPGYAGLRELDAFVAAGLSPYAALEAATRNPAEFMGRASDVGTVAVGRQADLILLDANPLADIANVRRLSGTMVAGRWLDAARLDVLKEMVAGAVK